MIYFDNASTTKIDELALNKYNEVSNNFYYNCSSLHKGGMDSHKLLENARETILNCINGSIGDTLLFCSGATEANNMAFFGMPRKNAKILTSIGEHPSVFTTSKMNNLNVDYVSLDSNGQVDINEYERMVKENKYDFISIMYVNNETGAINDVEKLCSIAKTTNPKCIFHSDCVQAFGKIDVLVDNLGVDAISLSAHKINGPKGIGALYIKKGTHFNPINFGGGQEFNLRSGTENLPAIVAFAEIAKYKVEKLDDNYNEVKKIKNNILSIFNENNFHYKLNGSLDASPYILSLSLCGVKGEVLLHKLEMDDILIGTGSACSSKTADNRILSAMGNSKEEVFGNIRLSFSPENTMEESTFVAKKIIEYANYLRDIKG